MGGRPRKSTAALELVGAFKKNPARKAARSAEPRVTAKLGGPPPSFKDGSYTGDRLLAIWKELTRQVPNGVLTGSDRAYLEAACNLMLKVRQRCAKSGDYGMLNTYLGKLGCNPSDRAKLNVPVEDEGDSLDSFIGRKSG